MGVSEEDEESSRNTFSLQKYFFQVDYFVVRSNTCLSYTEGERLNEIG